MFGDVTRKHQAVKTVVGTSNRITVMFPAVTGQPEPLGNPTPDLSELRLGPAKSGDDQQGDLLDLLNAAQLNQFAHRFDRRRHHIVD